MTPESLYREHSRDVKKFLLRKVRDEAYAEELMQDTFVKVIRHFDKFNGDCKPGTWLCSIALNVLRNRYTSNKRDIVGNGMCEEYESKHDDRASTHGDPLEQLCMSKTFDRLQTIFVSLSGWEQEIITLVMETDSFDHSEIVGKLNINPATVRSRLFKARKKLKVALC